MREYQKSERDCTQAEKDQLEAIIDAASLQSVLMAISDICDEKADRIQTNWQDNRLAKRWRTAGGAIGIYAVPYSLP